jgi:hypothetical protein
MTESANYILSRRKTATQPRPKPRKRHHDGLHWRERQKLARRKVAAANLRRGLTAAGNKPKVAPRYYIQKQIQKLKLGQGIAADTKSQRETLRIVARRLGITLQQRDGRMVKI